jgi:hypothetical protein
MEKRWRDQVRKIEAQHERERAKERARVRDQELQAALERDEMQRLCFQKFLLLQQLPPPSEIGEGDGGNPRGHDIAMYGKSRPSQGSDENSKDQVQEKRGANGEHGVVRPVSVRVEELEGYIESLKEQLKEEQDARAQDKMENEEHKVFVRVLKRQLEEEKSEREKAKREGEKERAALQYQVRAAETKQELREREVEGLRTQIASAAANAAKEIRALERRVVEEAAKAQRAEAEAGNGMK